MDDETREDMTGKDGGDGSGPAEKREGARRGNGPAPPLPTPVGPDDEVWSGRGRKDAAAGDAPPQPEPVAPGPVEAVSPDPGWGREGGDDRRRERGREHDGHRHREQGDGREQRRPADVDRQIVLPGDLLETGRARGGHGTFREGDRVYAAWLGIRSSRDGYVSVIPLRGKYIPRRGDFVVGKVIEMTPSAWLIDLNSPYVAPLPGSETPWDVQFGEASKYLALGDTVLVEIRDIDEIGKVSVTMDGPNLRKLVGGQTIAVEATKVPRVIGRGGSMIGLLKRLTRCHIIVGQNGRIWLDGTVEDVQLALAAIRMIEADAHKLGLTDAVAAYIEGLRKDLDAGRQAKETAAEVKEKDAILQDRVEREQSKSQEEE